MDQAEIRDSEQSLKFNSEIIKNPSHPITTDFKKYFQNKDLNETGMDFDGHHTKQKKKEWIPEAKEGRKKIDKQLSVRK